MFLLRGPATIDVEEVGEGVEVDAFREALEDIDKVMIFKVDGSGSGEAEVGEACFEIGKRGKELEPFLLVVETPFHAVSGVGDFQGLKFSGEVLGEEGEEVLPVLRVEGGVAALEDGHHEGVALSGEIFQVGEGFLPDFRAFVLAEADEDRDLGTEGLEMVKLRLPGEVSGFQGNADAVFESDGFGEGFG